MARGQKKEKKELTPEERLQNALVPEAEWPYVLPEGWKWVYLKYGFDVTSSKRIHKSDWRSEGIPFYRTRELVKLSANGYVDNDLFIEPPLYQEIAEKYGIPQKGDLLISGVGTIGVPYVVENDKQFYFKDGNVIWLQNKGNFVPQYIYYLFLSTFMYNQIHGMSAGTTVDTYTIINANKTIVPLPPSMKIQKAIVDFMGKEFRRLGEANDQIQSVLDSSEERKQSILHKAFIGELTEKWRKGQGVSKSTWKKMKLKDACNGLKYGTSSKSEKEGLMPVIRMGNLQHGEIDWDNLVYSNNQEDNEKYSLKAEDVLFNRTNSPEWVGKTSIYRGKQPAIYAGYLVKLDYKQELLIGEYLNYVMNSPEAKRYCNAVKTDGVNQSNISAKKIGEFVIPIPTICEQEEIIRIVNNYIDGEKTAYDSVDQTSDQIDEVKKALLSKAFRGELSF